MSAKENIDRTYYATVDRKAIEKQHDRELLINHLPIYLADPGLLIEG
jgi:hypothetical protein